MPFSPSLASKLVASGFSGWLSNRQLQFSHLGLKITTTVSWFVAQNQVEYGFLVALQN
jgi:hypothetical protein